jgi:hypothetical protein
MPNVPNRIVKVAVMLYAIAFWANPCDAQAATQRPRSVGSPVVLAKALSWLPADTETIVVANGTFLLPPPETEIEDEDRMRQLSSKQITEKFEALPTALVGLPECLLKILSNQKVSFAMEGSRNFRSPSELGEMPYEGCDIVVFVNNIADLGDSFMKNSKNGGTKFEEIEGQRVAVFSQKLEEDVWTAFVVLPKPNVLLVATNREYLRDLLARFGGATGTRALPDELQEWKYVNIRARCWGLRHYDKNQANLDPSSPFGGEKPANFPDNQAIGIVFNFGAPSSDGATITYLSGAKDVLGIVREGLFPVESDPDSNKDLRIHYREIAPGVVQGSFSLIHSEPVWYFTFILMAALGHGVYV